MQPRTFPPPKAILKFASIAIGVYVLLSLPWPGWERGYAAYFRGFGNGIFYRFFLGPNAEVKFLDLHSPTLFEDFDRVTPGVLPPETRILQPEGQKDTLMVLMNRSAPGSIGQLRTFSRWMGREPTVVMIAFALSTPLILRTRIWLLVWCFIVVHLFVAVRLSFVLLADGYAADKNYAVFSPSPFWHDMIWRGKEVFADNPTAALVIPFFLYLIVLFAMHCWGSWRAGLVGRFKGFTSVGSKRRNREARRP